MTIGNLMALVCLCSLFLGTYGLIREIRWKKRQRDQEKLYERLNCEASDS